MIYIQTSQIQPVYISQAVEILQHTLTVKYHYLMMLKFYSNLFYRQFGNFVQRSKCGYDPLVFYLKQERLLKYNSMEDTAQSIKSCIWKRIVEDCYEPILSNGNFLHGGFLGSRRVQRVKNVIIQVHESNTIHSESSVNKKRDEKNVDEIVKQLGIANKAVNDLSKTIRTVCIKDQKCRFNLNISSGVKKKNKKSCYGQGEKREKMNKQVFDNNEQYCLRKPVKKMKQKIMSKQKSKFKIKQIKKNSKSKDGLGRRRSSQVSVRQSQQKLSFVPLTPKPIATCFGEQFWRSNKPSRYSSRSSLSQKKSIPKGLKAKQIKPNVKKTQQVCANKKPTKYGK